MVEWPVGGTVGRTPGRILKIRSKTHIVFFFQLVAFDHSVNEVAVFARLHLRQLPFSPDWQEAQKRWKDNETTAVLFILINTDKCWRSPRFSSFFFSSVQYLDKFISLMQKLFTIRPKGFDIRVR